jgi:hypothetical protein
MRFKENDYDKDWMRCHGCTNIRKLHLWLTEAEWVKKIKAKEVRQGTAQRLMYCPACNTKKWISINLFKDKDLLICLTCKRKLPLSAYSYTQSAGKKFKPPKPKKLMEINIIQKQHGVKDLTLKVKIDDTHKGDIDTLAKNELELILIVMDTKEITLQIRHKTHIDVVLELRVCDNEVSKAKTEIEDMLKKMFTGKPLKKFLTKRIKYVTTLIGEKETKA